VEAFEGIIDDPVRPLICSFSITATCQASGPPDAICLHAPKRVDFTITDLPSTNKVSDGRCENVLIEFDIEVGTSCEGSLAFSVDVLFVIFTFFAKIASMLCMKPAGSRKGIMGEHDASRADVAGKPVRERIEVSDGLPAAVFANVNIVKFSVEVGEMVVLDVSGIHHKRVELGGRIIRNVVDPVIVVNCNPP